jgi:hypothetical protein
MSRNRLKHHRVTHEGIRLWYWDVEWYRDDGVLMHTYGASHSKRRARRAVEATLRKFGLAV